MHVDTVWCPSGPELVRGTTRTGGRRAPTAVFAKSLVTVDEVFLDELLTRSDARRRGFADHNLLQLLLLFPHKEWCRLQVRMDNTDVIKKYRKWTMKKYTHPKDEPNSGCMFMRAKCAAVVAALQSTLPPPKMMTTRQTTRSRARSLCSPKRTRTRRPRSLSTIAWRKTE